MYFLLSGEGPSDIGSNKGTAAIAEGADFVVGPMAQIVDLLVERKHNYSMLLGACGFVSEQQLSNRAHDRRQSGRKIAFPGKRKGLETRYFFTNARMLAQMAQEESARRKHPVVAVLFRDSDGPACAGRGAWAAKRQSMIDGFQAEQFEHGVPMIPRPKSEGWLICAWREPPLPSCEMLELESGNDRSPNSLKQQLEEVLGARAEAETLRQKVAESFDPDRVTMPSFHTFRNRLEAVLSLPAAGASHV
jgi:hypothetical protein